MFIYIYLLYILKFAATTQAYCDTISMADNGANCVLNADSRLKVVSEITFYECETDEQPIDSTTKNNRS